MAYGVLMLQWLMAGLVVGKAVFRDSLEEATFKQHPLIAITTIAYANCRNLGPVAMGESIGLVSVAYCPLRH
jgi:hypothetical protein